MNTFYGQMFKKCGAFPPHYEDVTGLSFSRLRKSTE